MNNFFAYLTYFLAIGSVLFLAYVFSKYLGNKSNKLHKGKNIKVIDSISIGLDKWLILVKTGKKVLLLCSSGKNIQLLTEMNESDIQDETHREGATDEEQSATLFGKYLSIFKNYINVEQKNTQPNDKNRKNYVFNNNLEKLKNKFSAMQQRRINK